MKEKINGIIAKFGRDYTEQISDSPDVVADQIFNIIIQKVKRIKNSCHGDEYFGFEKCREEVLRLLRG